MILNIHVCSNCSYFICALHNLDDLTSLIINFDNMFTSRNRINDKIYFEKKDKHVLSYDKSQPPSFDIKNCHTVS